VGCTAIPTGATRVARPTVRTIRIVECARPAAMWGPAWRTLPGDNRGPPKRSSSRSTSPRAEFLYVDSHDRSPRRALVSTNFVSGRILDLFPRSERRTSNVERRTPNQGFIRSSMLEVRCSMFICPISQPVGRYRSVATNAAAGEGHGEAAHSAIARSPTRLLSTLYFLAQLGTCPSTNASLRTRRISWNNR
jgi:hypothetical protein